MAGIQESAPPGARGGPAADVPMDGEWSRQLAENTGQVFWIVGLDEGDLVYVSPAYESIWGRSCQSPYAHPRDWLDAIHPDDRERVSRGIAAGLSKGAFDQEFRVVRPDGSLRWVHGRGFPIADGAGRLHRMAGVAVDITERKQFAAREATRIDRLQRLSELSLLLSGEPAVVFERVARLIGELFGVRVVCLSEIVGRDLAFRAVYVAGEVFSEAGSCPIGITPCATVEDAKDLHVHDRVMDLFPQASFLRDHQAHS